MNFSLTTARLSYDVRQQMKSTLIATILLVGTLLSQADSEKFMWRDSDGKSTPDTANMKAKDGFGGQFILSSNEGIYADWAKPETPRIDVASKLAVGELLVPVVIFVNPKKDKDGSIDVTYDLRIYKPDGSLAREISGIVCAKGVFNAPQFNLQLSQSEAKWGAEATDPLGTWTFKLLLKDNVRGIGLPLETSVEITKAEDRNKSEQAIPRNPSD